MQHRARYRVSGPAETPGILYNFHYRWFDIRSTGSKPVISSSLHIDQRGPFSLLRFYCHVTCSVVVTMSRATNGPFVYFGCKNERRIVAVVQGNSFKWMLFFQSNTFKSLMVKISETQRQCTAGEFIKGVEEVEVINNGEKDIKYKVFNATQLKINQDWWAKRWQLPDPSTF